MPYHRLFLHYIGITTLVYPYLVVLFNYFSYTYLFFSILLVVFFVGSYGATFILTPTGILLRYAGWITCGTGVIICLYAFATNHAMLIVLQGMFGVGNGLLRLIEREMIASVTVRELGRMPERHLLRRQFLVTALFAICSDCHIFLLSTFQRDLTQGLFALAMATPPIQQSHNWM